MVWPHSFKTWLRFVRRNPENKELIFFSDDDCHATLNLSFHLRTMEEILHELVIKAS